ncbi:MAG: hypothetical protein KDI68_00820 [Gammaproteobacteria bacterium]|nr:hypothetical protein [Gammaproteobacteria bacterium]
MRNLTPDGMLLANDAQLFQPGARVTIEVQHHAQSWCIPAVVTHSNNDCIGVMFQQRQAELFRNLSGSMMHLARGGGRHFMLRRANRQRGA